MTSSTVRSRRHLRLLMPLLMLVTALALPTSRGALADPVLPSKTARVVDAADILRSNQEQSLNAQLDALKTRSGVELVLVTLPGLQGYSIETWGRALGAGWYVGGKNGLGALLIVAPNDRQVRIEVGDALSWLLTDGEASAIIETRIIPQFRSGEISGGVLAGIEAMIREAAPAQINTLQSAPAGASWDSSLRAFLSRIDWAAISMPLLGVIVLVLMFWLLRRLSRQLDAVQSTNQTPAETDQSPGWMEWLRMFEADNGAGWVVRRRDHDSRSSDSSWSFGSFGSSGSGSSSAWSGSGSSGSWGSSRSSSSGSRSSSSSSSGRSSGGFSGRGASGRW